MFITHLGMIYTTYKNGDLGDGLLLFYPHYCYLPSGDQTWRAGKPPRNGGLKWQNHLDMVDFHGFSS